MDEKDLRGLIVVEGILLYLQFWLGMSMNLFIPIPTLTPFDFFGYGEGVVLLAHIINGIAILVVGSYIAYLIPRTRVRWLNIQSALSGVFVLIALAGGFAYVLGGQNDGFSMAMAMSFISLFTVFFAMIFQVGKMEGSEAAQDMVPSSRTR
ncbi:MAG TPA: hypothetical protein VGK23_03155 [Methanomassiliicoccales archaeon]|jgi:hypothetical protein